MSEDYYKQIFSKNLLKLMSKNNVSQADIIRDLKVNKSTISTWCNGTRLPRMDMINKLANYLKVNKSDLIEEKNEDNIIPTTFDSAQDAVEFILKQPMVAQFGGYDLDLMSEEEIIEMAEEVADMLKIMAKRHSKK